MRQVEQCDGRTECPSKVAGDNHGEIDRNQQLMSKRIHCFSSNHGQSISTCYLRCHERFCECDHEVRRRLGSMARSDDRETDLFTSHPSFHLAFCCIVSRLLLLLLIHHLVAADVDCLLFRCCRFLSISIIIISSISSPIDIDQ